MSGMSSMGGHGGAGAGHVMGMLPTWANLAWAAVFAALLVWHGIRAGRARGAARVWHIGHVAMAATMVAMYVPLPSGGSLLGPVAWPIPVGIATALLALGLAGQPLGDGARRVRTALWALTVLDVGAMVAMASPLGGSALGTCLLAATMGAAMVAMGWLAPSMVPAAGGRRRSSPAAG